MSNRIAGPATRGAPKLQIQELSQKREELKARLKV